MNTEGRVRAERRLAAILAADVAGYSRLIGADEEGTLHRIRAIRADVIDPKISAHHGRLVKTTGDGLLVEFGSVVDALRCATEVQREMAERNIGIAVAGRIEFRIGINVGDIVVEDGDIFGDGVNVAARLEGLADPGGICVSARVQEDVAGRLDLTFDDLGEQSVKNIVRPIRAYALTADAVAALPRAEEPAAPRLTAPTGPHYLLRWIAAFSGVGILIIAGSLWWLWPLTKLPAASVTAPPFGKTVVPAVPRLSIVVLPFVNLSDDPKQQYFVDGVTEDLTTDLSRISGSFVISRNTAFTYKDKPINARQIGHELGVSYVLEGSVQRLGNHVRVNTQLIDAETDAHVWADRFDRDIGDLFALQTEITKRIAVALNLALIRAEAARPTANPDALDYIFRGRAAANNTHTRDNYAEAVSLFERALALDPHSAEAQALLAMSLVGRALDEMTDTANADIARSEDLVGKALTASPRNAVAHFVQGQILRDKGRCKEAIPEYETAFAGNPNSAFTISAIGRCKILTGLIDEGIPLVEQAILLSPHDANLFIWNDWVGQAHLLHSRTNEAIPWLEKASSISPAEYFPHIYLASAHALNGNTERAAELSEAERLGKLHGPLHFSIAYWRGRVRAWVGEEPKVIALFETTFIAGLRKAGMPEE